MSAVRGLLSDAAQRLADAGVNNPTVDATLLMAHVTGQPRTMVGLLSEVVPEVVEEFEALVVRRVAREPLQHLTGVAPFRYLTLAVGPGVFVPRPETELLVDCALEHLKNVTNPIVVDLCTGSGALALSIALECPGAVVHAVEFSADALVWASRNVEAHRTQLAGAGSSMCLLDADATTVAELGGALHSLRGVVDLLVTNPPYVPSEAVPRDPEVRDYDPAIALYGGLDGLATVRPLASQAARLLRPGGLIVVEHSDEQGESSGDLGVPGVLGAMANPGAGAVDEIWANVHDHEDLVGRPRFTSAIRTTARWE